LYTRPRCFGPPCCLWLRFSNLYTCTRSLRSDVSRSSGLSCCSSLFGRSCLNTSSRSQQVSRFSVSQISTAPLLHTSSEAPTETKVLVSFRGVWTGNMYVLSFHATSTEPAANILPGWNAGVCAAIEYLGQPAHWLLWLYRLDYYSLSCQPLGAHSHFPTSSPPTNTSLERQNLSLHGPRPLPRQRLLIQPKHDPRPRQHR